MRFDLPAAIALAPVAITIGIVRPVTAPVRSEIRSRHRHINRRAVVGDERRVAVGDGGRWRWVAGTLRGRAVRAYHQPLSSSDNTCAWRHDMAHAASNFTKLSEL